MPQRAVLALRQLHDDPDRETKAAGDAAARVLGHRLAPPYYLGSTGYYISATPPPNIMTAARGHRKPSRARANVKGGEIASVLPGEYRVLGFSTRVAIR